MNKVYAVSYELKTVGKDYSPLFAAIKASPKWWHYLDSTWLIYTSETPAQIWARLGPLIDTSDRLLIIGVSRDYFGWLPTAAWDWINAHATASK